MCTSTSTRGRCRLGACRLAIFAILPLAAPATAGIHAAWLARHDGPPHEEDLAYGTALDEQGNVYVTGWSLGAGTGYDCATVKFDAAGTLVWAAR